MAIKAVLFDVGGVLFSHIDKDLAERLGKKLKIPSGSVLKLLKSQVDLIDKGTITEKQGWVRFNKKFRTNIVPSEADKIHQKCFNQRKSLFSLACKLSEKFTVGILSNMPKGIIKFLRGKYDFSCFKYQFFSSECHMIKPNKNFYNLAIKKVKLRPLEIVFIDDKMKNVIGAREAGMKSLQYKSIEDTKKKLAKLGIK